MVIYNSRSKVGLTESTRDTALTECATAQDARSRGGGVARPRAMRGLVISRPKRWTARPRLQFLHARPRAHARRDVEGLEARPRIVRDRGVEQGSVALRAGAVVRGHGARGPGLPVKLETNAIFAPEL